MKNLLECWSPIDSIISLGKDSCGGDRAVLPFMRMLSYLLRWHL